MDSRIQRIHALIDTLPQAAHIPTEVRNTWIDRTVALGDHDPMWHARRLRGIGSSEIGNCVMSARGEYTPFQGARDVVLSKLMRLAPDAGSGDTTRGNALEPVIQKMFHERYGTRSETKMMKAMTETVVPGLPWMVGNPDDLCIINGKLYIVDYKAPRPDTLEEVRNGGGVKFEYACQIHHLERIGGAAGLKIEGRLLCSLDYNDWQLDVRLVEFDRHLLAEMIDVGNELWNEFVLQGDVPLMVRQPVFDQLSPGDMQTLNELAEQFAIYRTAGAKAFEYSDLVGKQMSAIAAKYRLDGARIALIAGNIKAKEKYDMEVLAALAQRHGLELETSDQDSVDRVSAKLEELGEPRARYIEEVPSFLLSRAKKGPAFELVEACKEEGAKLLQAHAQVLAGKFLPKSDEDAAVKPARQAMCAT